MAKDNTEPQGFGDEPGALDAVMASTFPGIQSVDPEAVAQRMAKRVQSADTLDDLFDSLTGKSSDQLVGKRYEFREVAWQPYEATRDGETKVIPLALCEVVDLDTGEADEFVTTAFMLTQFLRRAQVIGALPFRAKIVEKTTRSGQSALNFERV